MKLALALLLMIEAGGGGVPGPAWDGYSVRRHADVASGLGFDLPVSGMQLESRHFEPDAEAAKLEHSLTLTLSDGPAVVVDVWRNPDRLALQRWFDQHLAFMVEKDTAVLSRSAGRARVEALLLEQPRTGQAFARKVAVFALGDRVLRVSCINRDDRASHAAWERILDTLEEVAR